MSKEIQVPFTEKELRVIKASLTESIKKAENLSKKWNAGILGPNPFMEVTEGLRGMIHKTNQAIFKVDK